MDERVEKFLAEQRVKEAERKKAEEEAAKAAEEAALSAKKSEMAKAEEYARQAVLAAKAAAKVANEAKMAAKSAKGNTIKSVFGANSYEYDSFGVKKISTHVIDFFYNLSIIVIIIAIIASAIGGIVLLALGYLYGLIMLLLCPILYAILWLNDKIIFGAIYDIRSIRLMMEKAANKEDKSDKQA